MDLGLGGRVAVVTGGASNIGRAISHVLAAEGPACDLRPRRTDGRAHRRRDRRRRRQTSPSTPSTSPTPPPPQAAADAAGADLGPIAVLVNNVGWNGPAGFFLDLPPERWEQAYRLNVYPTLNATRAVLPGMVERRDGTIVSIASDAGFGEFRMADYGPMKAGVMAFTRIIAKEYGRYGIRANTVCPGLVIPEPERSARAACGRPTSASVRSRSPTWSAAPRCAAGPRRSTSPTPSRGSRREPAPHAHRSGGQRLRRLQHAEVTPTATAAARHEPWWCRSTPRSGRTSTPRRRG